jgi:hypothetical protein
MLILRQIDSPSGKEGPSSFEARLLHLVQHLLIEFLSLHRHNGERAILLKWVTTGAFSGTTCASLGKNNALGFRYTLIRWRNFFRLLLLYHFWKLRWISPFPFPPVSNDENLYDSQDRCR